jgi:hypothetical protein
VKKAIALFLVLASVVVYGLQADEKQGIRTIEPTWPQTSQPGKKTLATTYSPTLDVNVASDIPGTLRITAEAKVKNTRRDANYCFEFEIRSGGQVLGKYRLDQPTFIFSAKRNVEAFPTIRNFTLPQGFPTAVVQVYATLIEDVATVDTSGNVLATESIVAGELSNRVKIVSID